MDNCHRLTSVTVLDDGLAIGLDNLQTLTIRGPFRVVRAGKELTMTGFSTAVFGWRADGSRAPQPTKSYTSGTIDFVSL